MPQPVVRLLTSIFVVVHLGIVALAVLGHRGTSYLHDDLLSALAPYSTLGNWRVDTNRLAVASASQLGEAVLVEWHERSAPDDVWQAYPKVEDTKPGHVATSLSREQQMNQLWLQQITGLLLFDNDEGVGQMLSGAIRHLQTQRDNSFDKVRISVAPRPSMEQYLELQDAEDPNDLPETLKPQVAYMASVVDTGSGQFSFLRQLEGHRASKSLLPSKRSSSGEGKRP